MIEDENYLGFVIKLKSLPQHGECLAVIRDSSNQTIDSDYQNSEELARKWAQEIIDSLISKDNMGISKNA
ncbi:MAG: hypothetical protein AAF378_18730 [Cyanobacteria bacterium P01_A01_bin.84]